MTSRLTLGLVLSIAFASLSANAANLGIKDFNFIAPTIFDRTNITAPQAGLIVYDSNAGGFFGASTTGTWQALGNGGLSYLAQTSSDYTGQVGDDGIWPAMSGNSVTLTSGTWILNGSVQWDNNGVTPNYDAGVIQWSSASGTGTGTAPRSITVDAGSPRSFLVSDVDGVDSLFLNAPTVRVTIATPTTVYLTPRMDFTATGPFTETNARVRTIIYAQQIQ